MDTLERELLALEQQYWQAIKNKDVDAALRLTDDQCMVAGAQGVAVIDRAQMERMLRASSYDLRDYQVTELKVRRVSDDVAIVAYRVHEELIVDGKPIALDAADASTWVRRDGRWVCALHTESLAGDPFGRDRVAG
jgi:uncharacterized protein (TIGR02246 family)